MKTGPWKLWAMATASTLIGAVAVPLAMLLIAWWEETDGGEG